jgi:signal transduction histidine kinase
MSARAGSRLPLLFLAIFVPCVALGALGIRALMTDASQTEARFKQQAESALDAATAAVDAAARGLPAGVEGSLAFVLDRDGGLLQPASAESRPASRTADEGTAADLLLAVLVEVEGFERAGELERAAGRLGDFLKTDPPGDLAASALTALAAVEKKRGRVDAARDAWQAVVEKHPDARDARGLKRAFGARLALVQSGAGAPHDLVKLYDDLVRDDREPSRPGTGALKRHVRTLIGTRIDPVDEHDRELAAERQLRAALATGLREWIASGGRGTKTWTVSADTRAAADESRDPVRVVVSASDGPDTGVRGGIAPLDAVIAAGLGRPEAEALPGLGFPVAVVDGSAKGPASPRSLGDRFGGVTLGVAGADLEAFRARERSRLFVTAALAGLGVLIALAAAFATARAVRREIKAARDRENFVAAVTHELKAPIASIRLLAEVLSAGDVEESKVREFGDRVVGECDRLGRLVSGVLELSRIESEPGFLMRLRAVDAGDLARDVVRTFEPVARERGFSVTLMLPDRRLPVSGDKDALASALLNLLDNAVKYTDRPGNIDLEVAAVGKGHAAFAILDRGRGVPAADQKRIFEPFTRLGDEMTRDRPGVGLGLALVSRIATAHRGTVACEAREGGGSRFTVVLPLAEAAS